MLSDDADRLRVLFEKVRPFVEERCGPGSLTEAKFLELCSQGADLMRRIKIERQLKDRLIEQLDELKRRVERLEAQS